MSDYLVDAFVTTTAGEPFRLFPFGTIAKGGRVRQLTRELAAKFRLPHFKPPIKLGSHKEETPAAGHIVGLQVRDDGLYAVPEWTDDGAAALARGAYRYHSPEIIWEGAGLEDATTGALISGPLIIGDALLHMPALGEAAALYHVQESEVDNMSETITVSTTWFERLLNRQPDPEPVTVTAVLDSADNFEAERATYEAKVAEYAARIAQLEAERQQEARVAHFAAELSETALADDADLAVLLSGLSDEQAAPIVQRFRALSAQVNASLTTDAGHEGELQQGDPVQMFDAAVKDAMKNENIDYPAAVQHVRAHRPELFDAYAGGR